MLYFCLRLLIATCKVVLQGKIQKWRFQEVLNGYLIFGMARVNLDLVDQVFNHRGVEIFQKEIEQLSCFFYV